MALLNVSVTLFAGCSAGGGDAPGGAAVQRETPPDTPAAVVQQFLELHFAGRMAFDPASVADKREFLSDGFATAIDQYFAKLETGNDAPAINGDLFTDSQEYPTQFAVQPESVLEDAATVPVRFSDSVSARQMSYHLIRVDGVWRIDDVRDDRGSSLRVILH